MADNYLEKKFEELRARKAGEERAREVAWKKRMDAYRKRLAAEAELNRQGPEVAERQPEAEVLGTSEK